MSHEVDRRPDYTRVLPVEEVRARLASRGPTPCDPPDDGTSWCPGWAIIESDQRARLEIQRCDTCTASLDLRDDDVAQLPEAQAALMRERGDQDEVPEFSFVIPAIVQLRVKAATEAKAREVADTWQGHAADWEEFATVEDPGDYEELPAGVTLTDATAYVRDDGSPETWDEYGNRRHGNNRLEPFTINATAPGSGFALLSSKQMSLEIHVTPDQDVSKLAARILWALNNPR